MASEPRNRAGIGKADGEARALWGDAYNEIPKSVFALAAFYLAEVASGHAGNRNATFTRFREEMAALHANNLMTDDQAKRVAAALAKVPA